MDEFDKWLASVCAAEEGCEGVFLPAWPRPYYLTPEQARRLALRLLSLSGHAPGPLPAGELEAIRGREERRQRYFAKCPAAYIQLDVDRAALLAALDSALADLAAAEGALHDLTSPQSGEANAAYLRGVEAGRLTMRALLAECQAQLKIHDVSASHRTPRELLALVKTALESPPAPAAAPGGATDAD